ncbi:hypothetical protein Purlil1_9318 [Purpureocillium lilacinum]|uniref:Uncharacterized protein n=1 Tax=Purpureocillium lilacinum TaxID=33203 RepID=A0ABR0BQB1_PURLI|nr:hypothetical protein Purlil1_9318 [Purpureocillium lilacinum]
MLSYLVLLAALAARCLFAAPASHSHRSHRSLHSPSTPSVKAPPAAAHIVDDEPIGVILPRNEHHDDGIELDSSLARPLERAPVQWKPINQPWNCSLLELPTGGIQQREPHFRPATSVRPSPRRYRLAALGSISSIPPPPGPVPSPFLAFSHLRGICPILSHSLLDDHHGDPTSSFPRARARAPDGIKVARAADFRYLRPDEAADERPTTTTSKTTPQTRARTELRTAQR